jgi:hypothetical protein
VTDLYGQTVGLLRDAYEIYRDNRSAQDWLGYHLDRVAEPLRVAVTGPAGSGKSTVVNAVVGERVAPVTVAGSQVLTWYADSPHPQATVYTSDGTAQDVPFARDLRDWQPDQVTRVAVRWPARSLRYATLIDTPAGADVRDEADAVLHLVTTVDGSGLDPVREAQDTPVARAAPVSTILVLARADEIGAGRVDALSSARLVARRFGRRPEVRALCQHAVAVAGLVGYAGRTLTGAEYEMIKQLAGMPRPDLDAMLLSTDRFRKAGKPALLDRYGIFGLRLATTLVRGGCGTAQKLSAELVRRSGLAELRESISRDFTDRPQVLKARSALLALERLLTTHPRGARQLAAELERVVASAHEFRELRLLAALRTGRVPLPAVLVAEAEHLLGGRGTSIPARLAIDREATDAELSTAAGEALMRWRDQAANPVLGQQQRRAAQAVVRSCEAMLSRLAAPARG